MKAVSQQKIADPITSRRAQPWVDGRYVPQAEIALPTQGYVGADTVQRMVRGKRCRNKAHVWSEHQETCYRNLRSYQPDNDGFRCVVIDGLSRVTRPTYHCPDPTWLHSQTMVIRIRTILARVCIARNYSSGNFNRAPTNLPSA